MLDLMVPKERDWMMRESEGGGKTSFGVQQEKNLELKLKLGPPGLEEPSALSLGYVPKASKTTKRGFFLRQFNQKSEGCPPHAATVNAAGGNRNSSQPRLIHPKEDNKFLTDNLDHLRTGIMADASIQ